MISARQIPVIYQAIQDATKISKNPDHLGSQFFVRLRYSFGFLNELHIMKKLRDAETCMLAFGKFYCIP